MILILINSPTNNYSSDKIMNPNLGKIKLYQSIYPKFHLTDFWVNYNKITTWNEARIITLIILTFINIYKETIIPVRSRREVTFFLLKTGRGFYR